MPEDVTIPLQIANDKEKDLCWKDFLSPMSFAKWLSTKLFVRLSRVDDSSVVTGTNIPDSIDADKIWINNGSPPSISFFIDGRYCHWYKYPVAIPFIWRSENGEVQDGMRPLTSTEIQNYGLSQPTDGSQWVIFLPTDPN